jgi:hypothetical protein
VRSYAPTTRPQRPAHKVPHYRRRVRRTPILLTGIIAITLAAFAAVIVVVGTALDCGGSDVSEPSSSSLCESGAARVLAYVGGAALIVLPVIGTAASMARERWRPLAITSTVAAAGFLVFFFTGG